MHKSWHGNGSHVRAESKRQEEINHRLMNTDGTENPFKIWRELGDTMTKNCTVIRYNKNLKEPTPSWSSCWSATATST